MTTEDRETFYAQAKLWYAILTKGFGLAPSAVGVISVTVVPWLVPAIPKVLGGYMVLAAVLFFLALTFLATSLRISSGRPRPGVAAAFFGTAIVAFLGFLWLLDDAPQWPLIHEHPHVVRGITALPYGLMIGAVCAGLAVLTPTVPIEASDAKKNAAR